MAISRRWGRPIRGFLELSIVAWGNTTIWGKPLIVINKFNQFIKEFYFHIIFITINEIVSEFSTISNGIYVTL